MELSRTVKLKLETNNRKNEYARESIDEWQEIAARMADLMVSFPEYRWGETQDTHFTSRLVKEEFPDTILLAHHRNQAAKKVTEAFGSWLSNGKQGRNPKGEFGEGDYMRVCNCGTGEISVEENDRGYGVKMRVQPYNPEWFQIISGDYQDEILAGVVDGEYSLGSGELHLTDDGELYLHISYSWEVDMPDFEDIDRHLGVDLGEIVMYSYAVTEGDEVLDVHIEKGGEFRHYRDRIDEKKARLQEKGDLTAVKEMENKREKYTEQMTDVASRRIVEAAVEHRPCAILLEDLTHYRETAEDPIHDWPYGVLQEKIAYKAKEESIPVKRLSNDRTKYTSLTCRECGVTNKQSRKSRDEFECVNCGYEVHADVNAAINIAQGGVE
jgi:putative transposase